MLIIQLADTMHAALNVSMISSFNLSQTNFENNVLKNYICLISDGELAQANSALDLDRSWIPK